MSKKFLGVLVSLLLVGLVFSATPAYAQEQADASIGEVSDPGILPGSSFYFAKTWGRAIRSFLTFDTQEKAKLALRFANEDTLAIKKLSDKGEYELAQKHSEKFQEQLQRAIQWTEKAKQEGKDIEGLVEKLKENQLRQQQILTNVLEKAPEQARERILNAAVNSSVGLENAIGRIQQEQQMEQFREEVNLQLNNAGEEIRIRIQEGLEIKRNESDGAPAREPKQEENKQGSSGK